MKKIKKVLVIGGVHGNEQWANTIAKYYKQLDPIADKCKIKVMTDISLSVGSREAQFNLNRFSDIERLHAQSKRMKKLQKEIDKSDVVIDIHNSPAIQDFFLITVPKERKPYKKHQFYKINKAGDNIHTFWRESDSSPEQINSIAQYARQQGKIGITYEINKMNYIPQQTELIEYSKNLNNLIDCIVSSFKNNVEKTKEFTIDTQMFGGHFSKPTEITDMWLMDQKQIRDLLGNSNLSPQAKKYVEKSSRLKLEIIAIDETRANTEPYSVYYRIICA